MVKQWLLLIKLYWHIIDMSFKNLLVIHLLNLKQQLLVEFQ